MEQNPPADLSTRRWIARLVRIALVVMALAMVGVWIARRAPDTSSVQFETEAPAAEALGAGDIRIFNRDSAVQVILVGDRILAGLSPVSVERVRAEIQGSVPDQPSGLGDRIASTVKRAVADNIGLHVVYPLRDVNDVRFVNGRLVIDHGNKTTSLFRNVKIDGSREASAFREEDAQRFIEAVKARRAELQP